MKAWILKNQAPIENLPLELKKIPEPEPGARELRIKNVACGVCRTDIHIAEGDLPLKKSPLILGHEIVGVVDKIGEQVTNFNIGDRVGITWLNRTCGKCKFCLSDRENLCPNAHFTGWDADGGYAEFSVVSADFAFHLGKKQTFKEIAPLMCPGVAGYRAFRLTELQPGDKLGLYGYGPTANYVLQVAKHKNIDVYVITRSEKNRMLAKQTGADWVGRYDDKVPEMLDGGIIFPPVGNLVSHALSQLDSGGRLVLGPVTMSPIEIKDYNLIWQERSVISLAHITRKDCVEFLPKQYNKSTIIVTPIGGNGFIFGRASKPFTPEVLRLIGKENIVVVATEDKINKLECLRVDTGNIEVDKSLNGFIKVISAYKKETIIEVK